MLWLSSTLRTEERAASFRVSMSYLSLMVDYIKSFGREQSRQHKQSQFYAPSMYKIVFTSDWLEPYTWRQNLSLYLSRRKEPKGRLYKLSVQVHNSDCAYGW